jgi:hypothetical protein
MTRRLLATLFVTAVAFGLAARAADPVPQDKKPADVKKDDGDKLTPAQIEAAQKEAALKQEQLKGQFDEFKQGLLRLAQRLDSSPKPEDKEKAKALRDALNATGTQAIDAKFIALAAALKGSEAFKDLDQLNLLIKENNDLRTEIRSLIDLLLKDNREAELRRQREETEKLLERLKEIIGKQERHRSQVEMGRKEGKDLAKGQKDIKDQTRELYDPSKKGANQGGAKGEGKGAGKDAKEAKGEGKNDTKDPKGTGKESKSADSKSGDKPGEGKNDKGGDGKEGKPGEGKEGKPGDAKGEGKPGDDKSGDKKPGEGKEGKPGDGKGEPKDGDKKSGEGKGGAEPKEGKPSDAKGEGKPGGEPKAGEPKPGEGKGGKQAEPKSGSDSKGRGEGKGEGKPGDAKGGKPSDGKPGEGKGGQSQPGQQGQPGEPKDGGGDGGKSPPAPQNQPQDMNQAKKKIKDANDKQDSAEKNLEKEKKPEAVEDEDQAIAKLKEAQKKLEDLLRQLREEEAERLLAQLQGRCERMRAMQIAVRDATITIDKAVQANPDKKPTRADAQSSNVQSDKEQDIVKEASAAIKLIETEGTAVAFAEVFRQVRSDMMNVRDRLRKTDVGVVTVAIENQIIDDLGDMIEALKKARQDNKNKNKPPPPGQSGPPPDPKLLDVLQELKLILARQKRVNARTELYGKQYEGEQAVTRVPDTMPPEEREHYEMIQKELKELASQQEKLGKVTNDISKGKNKAN